MGRDGGRDVELKAAAVGGMIAAMTAASPAASPEAEIRAARARSNAAIAAHDVAAMKALFVPDAVILPGSSGAALSMDGFDARIGATFADPEFVRYVRTPTEVTVARSGRRAAETGRWVGEWRKPDGALRLTGVYQAMWVPTPAGWRIRNESFVTLACTGSAACGTLD